MPTFQEPATAGDNQPLLVDDRTAASLLGVSPRSIWSIAASGELPSLQIGRRKLYSMDSLRKFIRQREAATTAAHSWRVLLGGRD